MPNIKQYTRQNLPNELINVQSNAGSFGGDTTGLQAQAQGMQELSSATGELSNAITQIKLKRDESNMISEISALELENMKRIEELGMGEYEDDADLSQIYIDDFKQRAESRNIPRSMQDKYAQYIDKTQIDMARAGMSEQANRAGIKAKMNWENTLTNATNMVTLNPNSIGEAEQIVRSQLESLPNMRDVDRQAALDGAMDGLLQAKLNTLSQKDPYGFKAAAQAGEYNDVPNLSTYLNRANSEVDRRNAKAKADSAKAVGVIESRLDLALAQAESSQDLNQLSVEIDSFEKIFGEEKANDFRVKLVKANKDFVKKQGSLEIGALFARGEATLNPQDTEHKKALDNYYRDFTQSPNFVELDPVQKNISIADMVTKSKFVPDTLKGEIQMAARSQDAEVIKQMSELKDMISVSAPQMLESLGSKEDLRRIDMVNSRANAGVKISEAIKIVDEKLDPRNAPEQEQVKKEIAELVKSGLLIGGMDFRAKTVEAFRTYGDYFSSYLGGGIDESNVIQKRQLDNAAMNYRVLWEDAYAQSRDADQATKEANQGMGLWGRTATNPEPMIIKHPPEQYYNIENHDSNWIREQAIDDIFELKSGGFSPQTKDELRNNLYIIPDPDVTDRTASLGQPQYRLMYIDPMSNSPVDLLLGDLWKPDIEKEKELLKKYKTRGKEESFFYREILPQERVKTEKGLFYERPVE